MSETVNGGVGLCGGLCGARVSELIATDAVFAA